MVLGAEQREAKGGVGRAVGRPRGMSAEWPTITGLSRIPETLAFRRGYVHPPRQPPQHPLSDLDPPIPDQNRFAVE